MPRSAVYTIFRVRLLTPVGTLLLPVYARTWQEALTTLQVILLSDGTMYDYARKVAVRP